MHPHQYALRASQEVQLLSVSQACQRLGCARSTFYEKIVGAGLIPIRKIGASSRIRSDDLDRYIDSLPCLPVGSGVVR